MMGYWIGIVGCLCAVAFTGTLAELFMALLVVWATFLVTDTLESRK